MRTASREQGAWGLGVPRAQALAGQEGRDNRLVQAGSHTQVLWVLKRRLWI
jgi:hypothetical protein